MIIGNFGGTSLRRSATINGFVDISVLQRTNRGHVC